MMKLKLTLYIGNGCRFCKKVTDYLEQHPMDVEIKDAWANEAINQEMVALTGSTQVPCLKIDNAYMHESLDIIDKLTEIQKG
ncbi:MAG TPA: glutaredoxin [Candidatus Berkiella sp.]|nr:glutaredoxin [Candidatus Berkiella sp.]